MRSELPTQSYLVRDIAILFDKPATEDKVIESAAIV
jgi:hypothetical protein